MTGAATTARVWLAVAGVVVGIATGGRAASPTAISAAAVGLVLVARRRRPALALIGIFLVACGLGAARPTGDNYETRWGGRMATDFRSTLAESLRETPERTAALLSGLTIGDTSSVDDATTETFRRSGLAHLVAVSGSNIAIVLAAIAAITIGLPLVIRGAVALIALSSYVAIVGPEPSVLRAAAMGVVGVIAYIAGRRAASLNSLGIALIAVLAAKPALLFSIGLHLSAAATLGIVVWSRAIEQRLMWLPAVLRAPIAITLSAQVAVAPLLIVAFERLSLVAPVANVLAAPAVPPATIIGLSAGVAGSVWTGAGRTLGRVATPFAQWILWVADETARWSWSAVDVRPLWGWLLAVPVGAAALVGSVRRAGR